MGTLKINAKNISSIRTFEKLKDFDYEFVSIKSFWWGTPKTGFFWINDWHGKLYSESEILELGDRYIVNNEVYFNPHVWITLKSGTTLKKFFKDIKEMENYLQSPEFKQINWIDIF